MPEAVIVATARSPIGRAVKGSLATMRPDDLAAQMVRAVLDKVPSLDPKDIDAADGPITPRVAPADRAAVAAGERVLGRELRPRRSGEKRLPERADCRLPLMPLAIGRRRRCHTNDPARGRSERPRDPGNDLW